ncbi:MAG: hypothetical protein EA427_12255 [Spirochaetaceae bacterium]|nr:MAG: hypothetical protein EA427_12255 [Spirochaetaceae bacterium]
MKREDFVWTIGYQDDVAIVDGPARKRYRNKSAEELLQEGLYRAAFCAAVYDDQTEDFLPRFVEQTGIKAGTTEYLQRLYGVFGIPRGVRKVSVIG